jgi:TetR/AcrR family transcriptional regulator
MPRREPSKQAARREKTRAAILAAAQRVFAEAGFGGARVEEIARRAGVNRASIFYYFEGKGDLYQTVLQTLVAPLLDDVRKVLALGEQVRASGPAVELIERGVSVAVDFLARNPNAARILLRELADYQPGRNPALSRALKPIVEEASAFLEARAAEGRIDPIDPVHLMTTLSGATLVFITGTPILDPRRRAAGLREPELAKHKSEMARIARRLLGVEDPR